MRIKFTIRMEKTSQATYAVPLTTNAMNLPLFATRHRR